MHLPENAEAKPVFRLGLASLVEISAIVLA